MKSLLPLKVNCESKTNSRIKTQNHLSNVIWILAKLSYWIFHCQWFLDSLLILPVSKPMPRYVYMAQSLQKGGLFFQQRMQPKTSFTLSFERRRDWDWTGQWNFRHVCKKLMKGEQGIKAWVLAFVGGMRNWGDEQSSQSLCSSLPTGI